MKLNKNERSDCATEYYLKIGEFKSPSSTYCRGVTEHTTNYKQVFTDI